jgi:LacI family transcriptional regulator
LAVGGAFTADLLRGTARLIAFLPLYIRFRTAGKLGQPILIVRFTPGHPGLFITRLIAESPYNRLLTGIVFYAIIEMFTDNVTGIDTGKLSVFTTMKRNRRPITIHNVAAAAGVSVSTVSRVLNDKDDVAPETFERVQQVISELGYGSSLAARGLRSHRTNAIGLVLFDIVDPFSVQVMRGIDRAIHELNYDLIVYASGHQRGKTAADRERRTVSLLDSSVTDGVIVVAPSAATFSAVSPIVVIDPNDENPDYPAVIAQNRDGALAAMDYLIGLGHRRIGFIGGRPELQSAIQRLQGYKDSLCRANLSCEPELVQVGDFSKEIGFLCAQRLLSLPNPPTAIFAANDQSAFGVYQAAREAGARIPADLSVLGFDNIPESAYIIPPLTTVDQSIEQMGFIATDLLVRLITDQELENRIYTIPTQLVVRASCTSVR